MIQFNIQLLKESWTKNVHGLQKTSPVNENELLWEDEDVGI